MSVVTPRGLRVLLAFGAACVLLAAALSVISIRTDMTEFLPAGTTPAARLILAEARTGTASGLIFIGLENADLPDLARISRTMAATLSTSGLFQTVAGGQAALPPEQIDALFAHRYLLGPADWSQAGLRIGLERVLRGLRGAAGPLASRFGLEDPPGAFIAAIKPWAAGSAVRGIDGAWFAPGHDSDHERALLLLRTKAGGMDIPAQETATAAIERAFAAAQPGPARLLVAGPAIFARDAARAIRGDVERISILSTLMVALLLWWRFRQTLVIAAIAAPVVASVAVAALAVQFLFGSVHGVALGFGATMLGIAVDYPVLMIGHRKRGEPAPATRARIARAFVLAVATATIGLAAMVFSGFPGLAQLGTFAATGLVTCAMLTWFGLPPLIVAANLAPTSAGDPAWLARLEHLRRFRPLGVLPVVAALIWLVIAGGPRWQTDLAALSPIPDASRALDRSLRSDLGAGDTGQFLLVRGADPESVLQQQEALLPALDRLIAARGLAGYDAAARLLPSVATQRARQSALPEPDALAHDLAAAAVGLPFRPAAFTGFLAAVEASRSLAPLTPFDLEGSPLATRLDPLLQRSGDGWRGLILLHGLGDPAGLPPGAAFIDLRGELGTILAGYTGRAWQWLGLSLVAILLVLAAGLRDVAMAGRTLAAIAAALVLTIALLAAAFGTELSLIHLVALQLVAGVGLDYALFFARRQIDAEERARTIRTLITCNAMTLLTFGLLATSQTPILRDLGITIALGAALALVCAFLITGQAPPSRS